MVKRENTRVCFTTSKAKAKIIKEIAVKCDTTISKLINIAVDSFFKALQNKEE